MDQWVVLLAPLATLVSPMGTAGVAPGGPAIPATAGEALFPPPAGRAVVSQEGRMVVSIADSFRPQSQHQVRIEQRITIRIAPRAASPRPLVMDLPDRAGPRLSERRMGKCLPISGIAGVQVDRGNRLMLFLRDRRMISLGLEKACRAQDFYSGFYVERSPDGQLCVDRDRLQSRSGANCAVTKLRQLVRE